MHTRKMNIKGKMKLNRCSKKALLGTLASLFIASDLFAAGDGHAPGVSTLLLPVFNFALYLVLMFLILKGPISTLLRARRDNLEAHIKRAAMHWDQARKQLLEVQRRFQTLDGDIKELSERIAIEAKKEGETLVADAKEHALMTIKRANEGALAERKTAENQVRAELAQAVLKLASEKLTKDMNQDTDRPLRERALDGIRALG